MPDTGDTLIIESTSEPEILPLPPVAQPIQTSLQALSACLNEKGRIDLVRMSEVSNLSIRQLILELQGSAMFQDASAFLGTSYDILKAWQPAAIYLSGNLHAKLKAAREMEQRVQGAFSANIQALEARLPKRVSIQDIYVSLGATWVPNTLYSQFATELLHAYFPVEIHYNEVLKCWETDADPDDLSFIDNHYSYGTDEMSALDILINTMNAKTLKISNRRETFDAKKNRWVTKVSFDSARTLAVQEKQKLILQKFQDFIYSDLHRMDELEELYNNRFVGFSPVHLDGSFLSLPKLNPEVQLYPHQRDAIARILLGERNVLLSHEVGTGKTYEMVVAAHELHRMGLSRRNMIVVPNAVLQDIIAAHRHLYPEDEILPVLPKDFTLQKRAKALEKIQAFDGVAIYMSYSSFDMVKLSRSYWIEQKQKEIRKYQLAKKDAGNSSDRNKYERRVERLSEKLVDYISSSSELGHLGYDELNIDTLFVDEAHNYKNIPLSTKADHIVGMHTKGSAKCKEMLNKCQITSRVIFATGTPLTNSLADLYTMQTYLQPDDLESLDIDVFDQWINTFAQRETHFEIDVDSVSLRPMTRFAVFHNLRELMAIFSGICDFHFAQNSETAVPLFRAYTNIEIPRLPVQKKYIEQLALRTEKIREGEVNREEDNLLKVTSDGRLCALDPRLVSLYVSEMESQKTKIGACAREVHALYIRYPQTAQLVFSDLGIPKEGFNVYDELKRQLLQKGIPADEIAFIHDATTEAARTKLFAQVNAGIVRVVIGSTQKLGTGVNVQERLIAAHHLSVPWRPSDMVQREGRIIRQGNTCEEVFIYRYITQGSFDSYSWQLLENKQRFISSFLCGVSLERDAEDIADAVLTYADVKALAIGNPLIKERIELANRMERLESSRLQRNNQLANLDKELQETPEKIKSTERILDLVKADIQIWKANDHSISRQDRLLFGEVLSKKIEEARGIYHASHISLGNYRGFELSCPRTFFEDKVKIRITSSGKIIYTAKINPKKPAGISMSLDRQLSKLPERLQKYQEDLQKLQDNMARAHKEIALGNPYDQKVADLQKQIQDLDERIQKEENANH